jgi:hypothetical protein
MEKWQMTFEEYCNYRLESCKYKESYLKKPELWEAKKRDLLNDWRKELSQRAKVSTIPLNVLKSFGEIFGVSDITRTFRGVYGKGIEEYLRA